MTHSSKENCFHYFPAQQTLLPNENLCVWVSPSSTHPPTGLRRHRAVCRLHGLLSPSRSGSGCAHRPTRVQPCASAPTTGLETPSNPESPPTTGDPIQPRVSQGVDPTGLANGSAQRLMFSLAARHLVPDTSLVSSRNPVSCRWVEGPAPLTGCGLRAWGWPISRAGRACGQTARSSRKGALPLGPCGEGGRLLAVQAGEQWPLPRHKQCHSVCGRLGTPASSLSLDERSHETQEGPLCQLPRSRCVCMPTSQCWTNQQM